MHTVGFNRTTHSRTHHLNLFNWPLTCTVCILSLSKRWKRPLCHHISPLMIYCHQLTTVLTAWRFFHRFSVSICVKRYVWVYVIVFSLKKAFILVILHHLIFSFAEVHLYSNVSQRLFIFYIFSTLPQSLNLCVFVHCIKCN